MDPLLVPELLLNSLSGDLLIISFWVWVADETSTDLGLPFCESLTDSS